MQKIEYAVLIYDKNIKILENISNILKAAGIKIASAGSLARFLTLIGNIYYNAIILAENELNLFCLSAEFFLREYPTETPIFTYEHGCGGIDKVKLHYVQDYQIEKPSGEIEFVKMLKRLLHEISLKEKYKTVLPDTRIFLDESQNKIAKTQLFDIRRKTVKEEIVFLNNDYFETVKAPVKTENFYKPAIPQELLNILPRKPAILLQMLIDNRNGISFDKIQEVLWRNKANSRNNIYNLIHKLRIMLKAAYKDRYIIHREGNVYKLLDTHILSMKFYAQNDDD